MEKEKEKEKESVKVEIEAMTIYDQLMVESVKVNDKIADIQKAQEALGDDENLKKAFKELIRALPNKMHRLVIEKDSDGFKLSAEPL
ncbi:MAG: hypothetical protein Q6363_005725 [Candidatus Njordarchaeota archaeon]